MHDKEIQVVFLQMFWKYMQCLDICYCSQHVSIHAHLQVFTGVATLLADMDVLLSFADLSVTSPTPYVRPSITSSVSLQLL
jgi:DNA mismatch repair protein MSH2